MPLDALLRAVWAMRGRVLLLIVVLYLGAAAMVLAWPRAYLASAVVAPAEGSGLAVSTLIAPINLQQSGAGLLDTRPTGNFAVYLSALRSPEAAAMLVRTTPILVDLSQRRAQAVVDFLASKSVDKSRFTVAGFGFDRPLDSRNPRSPANRRVEVVKAD
jgi:hypothetical protein